MSDVSLHVLHTKLQTAAIATGNGVIQNVEGYVAGAFQVSGTFIGTVSFFGTINGTDYQALNAFDNSNSSMVTTSTGPGIYLVNISGFQEVKAQISAFTSGHITVDSLATQNGSVLDTIAVGAITIGIVTQGDKGSIAQSWYTELTDGVNPLGTAANPILSNFSDGVNPLGTQTNPLFVEQSDGTNAQGTNAHPTFVQITDGTNQRGTTAHPIVVEVFDGANVIGTTTHPVITEIYDGANVIGTNTHPVFVELTDGANQQGTQTHPVFAELSDGADPLGTVANPIFIQPSAAGAEQGIVTAPLFVELSDGTNPLGTTANPITTKQKGYSYKHYAANTAGDATKASAGFLKSVTINSLGTTDTITLYDGAADTDPVIAVLNTSLSIGMIEYNVTFTTGLFVVIAGAVAPDLTIAFS